MSRFWVFRACFKFMEELFLRMMEILFERPSFPVHCGTRRGKFFLTSYLKTFQRPSSTKNSWKALCIYNLVAAKRVAIRFPHTMWILQLDACSILLWWRNIFLFFIIFFSSFIFALNFLGLKLHENGENMQTVLWHFRDVRGTLT